jgi:acyl-CoA thioesterase
MNNEVLFKKAEKIFYNTPFVNSMGIKLLEVSEKIAIAQFEVQKEFGNYIGGLHGGVVAGVIDTVVFFPGALLPSGLKLTTSGFDIKFFRPGKVGDIINVKAEILFMGKRRVNVEALAYFDNDKIVAKANVDLMKLSY